MTSIPGLSTLYAILKRDIERDNDILKQKKELASELRSNCDAWADLLMETFQNAIRISQEEKNGKQKALQEIQELADDFQKLDYESLRNTSPVLMYLNEDPRFHDFVSCCIDFYETALNIKGLLYHGIKNQEGEYVNLQSDDMQTVVRLYKQKLDSIVRRVSVTHASIKVLEPK